MGMMLRERMTLVEKELNNKYRPNSYNYNLKSGAIIGLQLKAVPDYDYDNNANVCSDDVGDSCDDCSNGQYDTSNDGDDNESDGLCDAGDDDDDNDGCDDDVDDDQMTWDDDYE